MRDLDKDEFKAGMDKLRTRYGAFYGNDQEWRSRLGAYFEQLRKHELRDVATALERAPSADFYPDRFPTSGQLQRLVIAAELERQQQAERVRYARDEQSEDERAREEYSLIPIGEKAQADYIAAATTPHDRLAREWKCESKRLGLDPTKPTPPEIVARRTAEVHAMLDRIGGPKTMPSRRRAAAGALADELARGLPPAPPRQPGDDTDHEARAQTEQPPAPPAPTQETA